MLSPGGPHSSSSSRISSPLFSAWTGKSLENKVPTLVIPGTKSPLIAQQTVCIKCNRHFRRSPQALPGTEEYERCEHCRNFGVGEWLLESCVIS